MTHTALDAAGAGTHRRPPEHVPDGPTGQARAWLPHVGDAAVATPPEGVHDPVGCGAATVTAVAKIGPPQEEDTVCVVPPEWSYHLDGQRTGWLERGKVA